MVEQTVEEMHRVRGIRSMSVGLPMTQNPSGKCEIGVDNGQRLSDSEDKFGEFMSARSERVRIVPRIRLPRRLWQGVH